MSADGEDNGRPSYVAEVTMPLQFLAGAGDKMTEANAPAQRRGLALGTRRRDSPPGGHFCRPEVPRSLPACFSAISR